MRWNIYLTPHVAESNKIMYYNIFFSFILVSQFCVSSISKALSIGLYKKKKYRTSVYHIIIKMWKFTS